MIGRVLGRTLWGFRTPLLVIAIGIVGFELVIALMWRTIGEENATNMFDLMPTNMKELIERQFGFFPTSKLDGWLAGLNRHPIYLILVTSFVVGAGAAAVAREIERGSILLVLARPVPRWRFLVGKVLASAAGLLLLMLLTLIGLVAGALAVDQTLDVGRFLWVGVNGYLLFLTVGGLSLLLSAAGDDGSAAAGRTAGIVLAAYFIDFLANLWSKAQDLGPLSFFHYYDPAHTVRTGEVPWFHLGVLAALALALHVAALVVFERRDIAR